MPQPAWLVYGPPGSGKTTWILAQVKASRKKLYHWNARTDRTLREGRETLHQQVRSQEPLYVWIEGADDLTPEAQAFLRRILETANQPVQCILECRDPQRITPAIQSRCEWKQCPHKVSFRKQYQEAKTGDLSKSPALSLTHTCQEGFSKAAQPIDILKECLHSESLWPDALLALKSVGAGSSPWAHVFALRGKARSSPQDSLPPNSRI
jgi:hypothetical protein